MKKFFAVLVFSLLTVVILASSTNSVFSQSADCVIPTSGPWPPCATGVTNGPHSLDCVIPSSGPWPSCATNGNQPQKSTTSSKPNLEETNAVVTPEPFGTNISLGFGLNSACHVVESIQEWSVTEINEKPVMTLAATYLSADIGQQFTWRLYDPFGVEILSNTETINGDDNCFTRDIMLPNYYTFGYYQLSITHYDTNIFGKMFFFTE